MTYVEKLRMLAAQGGAVLTDRDLTAIADCLEAAERERDRVRTESGERILRLEGALLRSERRERAEREANERLSNDVYRLEKQLGRGSDGS